MITDIQENPKRSCLRKERVGVVVSNSMNKTVIVQVRRSYQHSRLKKVVADYKKYYAHDEALHARVGDHVRIVETRPISKTKRWRVVSVVSRASIGVEGVDSVS